MSIRKHVKSNNPLGRTPGQRPRTLPRCPSRKAVALEQEAGETSTGAHPAWEHSKRPPRTSSAASNGWRRGLHSMSLAARALRSSITWSSSSAPAAFCPFLALPLQVVDQVFKSFVNQFRNPDPSHLQVNHIGMRPPSSFSSSLVFPPHHARKPSTQLYLSAQATILIASGFAIVKMMRERADDLVATSRI